MYKDISNKIGNRMLKGNSGKTYGEINSSNEAEALADGISLYKPVVDATLVASQEEEKRIKNIKMEARRQIFGRVAGTEDFEQASLKQNNKLAAAVILTDLKADGLATPEQLAELATLKAEGVLSVTIRAMSNAAELANDSVMKFRYDIEQAYGLNPLDINAVIIDASGNYVEDKVVI